MITHMAEAGLSAKEIQAQSGHSVLETLYGYIQHTSERIRSAYLDAFEDVPEQGGPLTEKLQSQTGVQDREYVQQTAFRKYLTGELDRAMPNKILGSTEEPKPTTKNGDRAYQ